MEVASDKVKTTLFVSYNIIMLILSVYLLWKDTPIQIEALALTFNLIHWYGVWAQSLWHTSDSDIL